MLLSFFKTLVFLFVFGFSFINLTSCSFFTKDKSNTLSFSGSDTMLQLSQKFIREYSKLYPEKCITIQGGGSGQGLASLVNQFTDIANASRRIKQKERSRFILQDRILVEKVVAFDGLAVIVHPSNPLKKISLKQLSNLFLSQVDNWNEIVPNYNHPVLLVARENNSGTHEYFKKIVIRLGNKKSKKRYGNTVTYAVSSQQIIDQVSSNKKAIGYIGLGWLSDKVKPLAILSKDNFYVTPTFESVKYNQYPLTRPLYMYTTEDKLSQVSSFFKFIFSSQGQKIVIDMGFIPISSI